MKLRVRGIITIAVALIALVGAGFMLRTPKATIYKKDVTVYLMEDELVTVIDTNGEEWLFLVTDEDCLIEGEHIKLIMNDMGTENPYDDEIIDFTYVR